MGLPLLICGAVLQLVHIVKRSMHQVEPPTAGTTQLPMLSAIDTANVVADGNVTAAAVVTRTASASCRGENASTSATAASPCNASGNGACLSLLERGDSAGAASAMHGTNGAANRTSSFNSAAGIKPNLMITEADNVEVDHAVQVTSNYNIASKNTSDNSTGRTVDVIAEVIMPGPQLESDAIAANWTDKNHNEAWDSEVEKADPLTEEQREFFTEALNMEAKMNPEASKPMATLFVSTTATEETQETKPEANISMNLGGNLTASSAAAANPVLQKALGTDPNGVMSVALSLTTTTATVTTSMATETSTTVRTTTVIATPVPQEEEATRTFTGTNGSAVNFTTSAQVREAIEKATAETYVDLGVSHVQPITFSTVDLAAASPSMLMLQEEEKTASTGSTSRSIATACALCLIAVLGSFFFHFALGKCEASNRTGAKREDMMTPSKGLASAVSECAVVDDMQQHENSERADEDQHLVSSDEEGRVVDEEADEEENPNALTPADKHADGKEDNESVFEQESSEHSSAGEGMAKDYLQAGGDNDSDSDGEFRQAGQDGEEAAAGASQAEEDAYAMDHAESSPMNNKIYDSNHDEDEVESASPGDSPSPTDSLSPVDEEQEIYEAWAPHLFEMDEGSSSTTTGEVNALPSCRASKDGSKSTCETTAAASSPCPTTDDEEPQSLVPPYPADGVLPVGSFLPFQQDAPLATATGGGAEADGRAQEVAAQVVHSMFFKKARQGSSSSSVLTKPILDAPPALRTGTLAVPFSLVSPAQLEDLLNAVGRIFLAEGIVVKPVHSLPTKVFGSLHGQLVDLLTFFQSFGFPHLSLELGDLSYTHYVFLGDYVDRGAQSLELLTLLFALKLQAPERVTLLRGHHENRHVNAHLGFRQECEARLPPGDGARLYDMINRTFELMPLACQLRSGFLCLPNGLPRLLDHELREHRTSAAGLRSLTHLESLMGTKPVIVPRPQALHSGDDLSESELFLVRYFYPHLSEVSGSSEKSGSTEEFLRESGGLCAVITSRRIPEGGAALAPLSIAEAEDGRGTQRDQSSSEGDRQEEKADPSRLNEISLVSCADVGGLTRNRAAMLQIVCDSKMNTHRVVIRRVASGPSSVAWELFVELFCGGSVALGLGVSENPEGEEENGVSRTAESHKEMRHLVCAVPETCAQFSRWPAQPMALTPRRVVHSAHSSSEDTLCVELLYPIDGSAPFTRTDRLKPAAVMALDTADRVDIASLNPLLLRTHSTGMPRGAEDAGTGPLQPRVWGKALSVFDSLVSYNGESLLSVSEHAVVDWLTERTQGDTSLGATAAVRSGTLARWVRSFLVFHRSSTEATNSQITAADFLWGIVASSGSVSLSEESLATRFSNYAVFARAAVVLQLRADEGVSDWDDGGALLEHSATRYGSADALDFFRDIFSHFL